ncbi:Hsp90 cochaperone [Hanseniaspora uvarum]|nr:Hsp90 cochaperone [Hanseniaspora uvarum]
MLTPKFDISQDDLHIFIKVHINNIRFSTSNLDITINNNMVNFSLLPYYLRLTFNEGEDMMSEEDIITQNMIQEVGNPGSQLEQPFECKLLSEEDVIQIKLFKKHKNQTFLDLDNHLRLLNRQETVNNSSMLNVVNETKPGQNKLIQEVDDETNDIPLLSKLGETFDWQIKQNVNVENDIKNNKIGFSSKYTADAIIPSIYNNNEINEVAEAVLLKDSEDFKSELIQLRNYRDNLKFDPDYYMNDYITFKYGQLNEYMKEDLDINGILEILKFVPTEIKYFLKWVKLKASDKPRFKDLISYNEFEQEQMREKLPKNIQHENFEKILSNDSDVKLISKQTPLFLQLAKSPKSIKFDDLNESWKQNFTFLINAIFGYFFQSMEFDYNLKEEQEGKVPSSTYKPSKREQTSERSWLIGKLSPQLSNLDNTLLLNEFGVKESCNWKPEFKLDNKDVDMEEDFIIKEVVEEEPEQKDIKISDLEDKRNIIKAALIISIKKSLSYPLHRNLQLSLKVVDYVNYTFLGGSKLIIKILLKIHELFRFDDTFYIYNKIWLDDMITWLLKFCDTEFHDVNNEVVKGDDILDELFKDVASKISFINRSFKKEDFDFMIIQSELNEQGDNIEWDSINIQEIENIADIKYKEFTQSI